MSPEPGNVTATRWSIPDPLALAMGVLFAFFWSSAFTSARIIVAAAPPILALSVRFLVTGLVAVAIARMLGQSWRLTPAQWRATVLFGICQNALYLGLNFVAMQWVEASLAAIIASTMPLLVGLLGWAIFAQKVRPLGALGLVAGFLGVAVIMGTRLEGALGPNIALGIGLCVIGALALALATLTLRGASTSGDLLMVVGLQMLAGAAVLTPFALAFETWIIDWSWPFAAAYAYTLIFPGLIATLIWFWLVNRIGAVRAATFHFLNPFFGVLVAAVFLSERISLWDLIGVAVIMLGILLVQFSKTAPS